MKALLIFLLLSFGPPHSFGQSVIAVFETDYCTNYPEGTPSKPTLWKHCCLVHDLYFWAGGTKEDRDAADLELRSCVEATGETKQAALIYYGVRMGSYSPIKYPKRQWGNGWSGRAKNAPLTRDEITQIEDELNSGYDFITEELKSNFFQKLHSRLD